MDARLRNFALWVIIILLVMAVFTLLQAQRPHSNAPEISFSQFLEQVEQGRVRDVVIQGQELTGTSTEGRPFQTYAPSETSWMARLYGKGISITVRPQQSDIPWYVSLLVSWLPFLALIGVWIFLSRQMQGRGRWLAVSNDEIDSLKRRIDELQKELDRLTGKDKDKH